MLAWWNKPGEWLLVVATGISLALLWLDVRDAPETTSEDASRPGPNVPDEGPMIGNEPPVR